MINSGEILATIDMISQQHLDVRTITMGISLRDCAHPDAAKCCGSNLSIISFSATGICRVTIP